MKAAFADTFYWIALTMLLDAAHKWAKQITADLVTTQEVLTEYLNFFSGSEHLRRKANMSAGAILQDSTVRAIPQSDQPFQAGLALYAPVLARGIASLIAFPYRLCGGRG